jgi:hypothetical protein
VGIGTDGCSAMTSDKVEAVEEIKFNYFSIIKRSEQLKFYWGYKRDYCIFNIFCETESCGRFYLCTKNKNSSSFEAIIDVLDEISEWEDTNASCKATRV